MLFIHWFFISIMSSIGLAVIMVSKRKDYPVRYWNINLRKFLRCFFGRKFSNVMNCAICLTFWATLITDIIVFFISGNYFYWPLSGFTAAAIAYFLYELLEVIEKRN